MHDSPVRRGPTPDRRPTRPKHPRRRGAVWLSLAIIAIALAGCGDDTDDGDVGSGMGSEIEFATEFEDDVPVAPRAEYSE